MGVFVIAEAATTWRYGDELATAKRSIEAAKACGADAWKTQWCSDGKALAKRRNMPQNALIYEKRLQYPPKLLESLKSACDDSGIEFMCTVFIQEDIEVIAPLVKRFKVSAFERELEQFKQAHYRYKKPIIISTREGDDYYFYTHKRSGGYGENIIDAEIKLLHCVSSYPTSINDLHFEKTLCPPCDCETPFSNCRELDGLSDHTTSVLTGAVAVGCGARIIEVHFRLDDTPESDPDFPHSRNTYQLKQYIDNIRMAERML